MGVRYSFRMASLQIRSNAHQNQAKRINTFYYIVHIGWKRVYAKSYFHPIKKNREINYYFHLILGCYQCYMYRMSSLEASPFAIRM